MIPFGLQFGHRLQFLFGAGGARKKRAALLAVTAMAVWYRTLLGRAARRGNLICRSRTRAFRFARSNPAREP